MADPTRAQIYTLIQAGVDMLEEAAKFGRSNSKNVLAMLNTLQSAYRGDYLDELEAAAELYRSASASNVSPGVAAAILRPLLRTLCKSTIGRGDLNDDQDMNDEIYRYFVDNAQRVQSRAITYGSPAATAGNLGNNQILRLTVDRYNFNIENIYADVKRAICVLDYQTGSQRGGEVLQVVGQVAARDDLQRSGSAAETSLVGAHADNTLLLNASFSNWTSATGVATAPDGITDWSVDTAVSSSTFELDGTNYFRAAPSDTTPYSLKVKATNRLYQKLSTRGTKLIEDVPYITAIYWNAAVGSGVGTLVGRMGAASNSVSVSGQSGWQVLLVPGSRNQSCWYRNFAEDDMDIEIQWTRTSGNLLIDDVLLIPGSFHDGTWYWFLPSATTAWVPNRINDSYTWTDRIASDSKVQKWLDRAFRRYWPHSVSSSITLSDPS